MLDKGYLKPKKGRDWDQRAVEHAIKVKAKLAAHRCDIQTLEVCKNQLIACVNQEDDIATKMRAAKFLMEHDWNVYTYENPQTAAVEHHFPDEIVVRLVRPGEVKSGTANT